MLSLPWIFVLVGLGVVLLELFVGIYTGFDLVLIGSSIILGGIVGAFYPNLMVMLLVTSAAIFLYLVFGRSLIQKKLYLQTHQTNIDALIGSFGVVVKPIKPHHPGQVKISGEYWRAESDTVLNPGDEIKVVSIQGVTLKVTKLDTKD